MYCNNCGTIADSGSKFCNNCGETLAVSEQNPTPPQDQYNPSHPVPNSLQHEPSYPMPSPHPVHSYGPTGFNVDIGPGSFAERLHSFGRSRGFLIGALLFTVGTAVNILRTFTVFSVFVIALVSLSIIGVWMIYAASSRPKLPEKTLTALTLFKISTIIQLVLFCLALAGVLILFAVLGIVVALEEPALVVFIIIGAVFVIGIFAAYIVFYYVSILRILSGIRNGIVNNVFTPIKGIVPLMVVVIVMTALNIIFNLIAIAASSFITNYVFTEIIREMPFEYRAVMSELLVMPGTGSMLLGLLMLILINVGVIMCIAALHSFNNSIKLGHYDSPGPPDPQHTQWQ